MFMHGWCRPNRVGIISKYQSEIVIYIMRKQGYTGLIVSPNHFAGRFFGVNMTKELRRKRGSEK